MNYLVKRSSIIASGEGDFGHVAEDELVLVEPPKWVPCSERLPEPFKDALTFIRHEANDSAWIMVAFVDGHGEWDCDGEPWGGHWKVTHWTPLPPGPGE